ATVMPTLSKVRPRPAFSRLCSRRAASRDGAPRWSSWLVTRSKRAIARSTLSVTSVTGSGPCLDRRERRTAAAAKLRLVHAFCAGDITFRLFDLLAERIDGLLHVAER